VTESKIERTGRCGCGGLTFTARGEPVEVYTCTCLNCQRESGGAFTYSALFPESTVAVAGERKSWRHLGDSGRWIETAFCPTCGTTVCFRAEGLPGLIGVSVGCLADPDFAKPATAYWASRRHRWLSFPADTRVMDTQPG
jgi:hypothetical protein